MVLKFLVRYQTLAMLDTGVKPLKGSAEYLQLQFTFSTKDWADLNKTLYISSGDYSLPFDLTSNVFNVPRYFTQQDSFSITLLGSDGAGRVVPTNVLTVALAESNTLWMAEPPDPENSAYLQLIRSLGDLEDLQTTARGNLVAAINELVARGGAANLEEIRQIVDTYLAANPPECTLTPADKTKIAEMAAGLVEVPSDEYINQLINTALAAIPNAAEVGY